MIDLVNLSAAVIKLIETVEHGAGFLLRPRFTRLQAKADADASLVKAEADAQKINIISAAISENSHLPIVYSDGTISIDSTDTDGLEKRMRQRLCHQEMHNEKNIEAVITHTYDELADEIEVSPDPVDQDWATHFFNSAGNISDKDMQKLWGKLLAGEIKQPGSFSLRTLERMRTLSKGEALLFLNISGFIFRYPLEGDSFIPISEMSTSPDSDGGQDIDSFLTEKDITFASLVSLDECGLIQLDSSIATGGTIISGEKIRFEYGSTIIEITNTSDKELRVHFHGYFLTTSGKELLRITQPSCNPDFFKCVIETWKKDLIALCEKKEDVIFEIFENLCGNIKVHED